MVWLCWCYHEEIGAQRAGSAPRFRNRLRQNLIAILAEMFKNLIVTARPSNAVDATNYTDSIDIWIQTLSQCQAFIAIKCPCALATNTLHPITAIPASEAAKTNPTKEPVIAKHWHVGNSVICIFKFNRRNETLWVWARTGSTTGTHGRDHQLKVINHYPLIDRPLRSVPGVLINFNFHEVPKLQPLPHCDIAMAPIYTSCLGHTNQK